MNILVMGAGAIGSVFGGLLAYHGNRVTLVGRNPHIAFIRKSGLKIKGIWGRYHIKSCRALTSAPKESYKNFDLILLCVKSNDTRNAVREIKHLVSKNTLVISLQNGLNNYETICKHIPKQKILMARIIFGAEIRTPGTVCITVYADEVRLGHIQNKIDKYKITTIAHEFTCAGIPTRPTDEILKFVWDKALYNTSLNPLSALLECTYGDLLIYEWTRTIMKEVVREIYQVARVNKIELFNKSPEQYIKKLFYELIPATESHRSSMLQDINKGKMTEIDALNGEIQKMASKFNITVPINGTLTNLIKAKEKLRSKLFCNHIG